MVIHENCQNDRGSGGWAGTAATKHSYYPSFMIFPSCFPPSFFSSIVSVLKLPFCSSFVSSPPLHEPILMFFICFPFVHPNEFSTTPSVLGRREEEFRVAMATTSWLQAICSLISTGREWWTYILNLIIFTLKKKKNMIDELRYEWTDPYIISLKAYLSVLDINIFLLLFFEKTSWVSTKQSTGFALIHSDNTDCSDCTRNKIVQETVLSPYIMRHF